MKYFLIFSLAFLLSSGDVVLAQTETPPPDAPIVKKRTFFPALVTAVDVAGIASLEFNQTFCRKDITLLPGIIPGTQPIMGISGSAISGPLKTYWEMKWYYDQWNKLQFPVAKLEMHHEIVDINLGDFYESFDPLSIYHQELRGGGVGTFFDFFDDLIKVNFRFSYGSSRTGSQMLDPVVGVYNVKDSVGVYPTYLGLAHFFLSSERYRSNAGFLVLNMEDNTKDIGNSQIFNLYPRRNRLYGLDLGYNFPEEYADCAGKVYLSSFRRNTNDEKVKTDQKDQAVLLETRGRYLDYGYHGAYNYIGVNYFAGGNPYLPVDKNGFSLGGSYVRRDLYYTTADLEFYRNNLAQDVRQPTINTLVLGTKFNLRKREWPNVYAGLRYKKAWSDSVVVDLVDPTVVVDSEETRKKDAFSLTFSLGGDYTWRGGWYMLWSDFSLYRDHSHYEHKLGAPANTNQWLLGLRHRQTIWKNILLSNGVNYQLTGQPAGGISDQSLYLTSTGDYSFIQLPVRLEGELGVFKQWSDLKSHDYNEISFSLLPRYLFKKDLSFNGGYELKAYTGRDKSFIAHTIKLGTEWVF